MVQERRFFRWIPGSQTPAWLVVLVSAAIVLAGCTGPSEEDDEGEGDPSDDGGMSDGGSMATNETQEAVSRDVSTSGNYPVNPGFDPENLEAPAGANLTVVLTNDDVAAEHAWRLEGVDGAAIGNVAPGESGEVTFTVLEPGEYAFYCPIGNHRQLGQEGVLEIT